MALPNTAKIVRVVGGFSGHGFIHGTVSSMLMIELILDGEFKTLDVSMLDLTRFEKTVLSKDTMLSY
jgi:glycine/D-amino acid oxidase-like deaminating enzyme